MATSPKSVVHRGDEAERYLRHHRALVRAVGRAVSAPREPIEDACQTAWLILLRRQPERARAFGWLHTVVNHHNDTRSLGTV